MFNFYSSVPSNNPLPLDLGSPSAAAYSLRKLTKQYTGSAIRIRRSGDNAEQDIGFDGAGLDNSAISTFIASGWSNLLPNPTLTVDANSNGIADGWETYNATGATYSIDDSAQKIANSGVAVSNYLLCSTSSVVTAGEKYTYKGTVRVSGPVQARLYCEYYAGNTWVNAASSVLTTSTTYTELTLNFTVPATITMVVWWVQLKNTTTNAGATWFKNVSLQKLQNAYVTKWYDQSGNGNDKVQTTAANQPRIVSNGTLDVDAFGKANIKGNIVSTTALNCSDSASLSILNNITMNAVHNSISLGGSSEGRIISKNDVSDYAMCVSATTKISSGNAGLSDDGMFTLGTQVINTVVHTADTVESFYKNGNLISTDNSVSALADSNANIYLLNNSAGNRAYDGYVSEIIIFDASLDDVQRNKLECNQKKYYSIT
jgi:hypothetical protein